MSVRFREHDYDGTEHLFTGKERDTESGNDYFGARYYASSMGRFMSPDWSAKIEPVPYSKLDDPQTLNLYAYVTNNPLTRRDLDGHCGGFNPATGEMYCPSDNSHMIAGPPPSGPPKIKLPPGKSGKPNGWKTAPDNPGGSRVKWVPNESVPGGKNGAQPSASWNEKGNWWSVNDGQGGPIQHVGEDGSLLDGNGQPIPDGNGGNVEPTIGQPAPAPTPPAPTSSPMEKVNDWLNEHLPESLKNYLREHPYGSNSSPAGAGAGPAFSPIFELAP